MNEIKVSVNFKTGKCIAYGYDPVDNDYNASKLVFNFDEEYDGRKIVEIRPEDSSSKEATFASEIINNEVILAKEVAGEYHSIFTTSGRHIIEVHLYSNGSKVTAICEKPFYVREEQINIGDEQATVYLPVFEQMIQELNTGLDNLSSGLNSLNNAITETNNLDLDVSKTDKEATVTIRKKDNTTKSITLSDGTSLMFHWRGTYLGIKTDKDDEYTYVNLQGIQGEKGETGAPFRIKKTYANIQLMIADYDNMQVDDHVMISGNVEQEDNAKLFTKTETEDPIYRWQYLGDFSGATGIKGETGLTPNIQIGSVVSGDSPSVTRTGTNENPILNFVLQKGEKGDTGNTGATGSTGNGIVSIIKTSTEGLVDTYTITYTNGTTTTFQITNGEDGEVTQAQLDAVQEEVDDLRRNQKQDTASGTNIYVDDAFDTRIMESRMSKESTQETTSGKNLLPFPYFESNITRDGITYTINKDNSITLNGTATAQSYIDLYRNLNDNLLQIGNTYTYSISPNNSNIRLQFYERYNDTWNDKGYGTNKITFTVSNDSQGQMIRLLVTNGATVNDTIYLQIEQGTTATDFEKYTGGQPSPSPEFPQKVKTVKGYRNLFDKNNANVLNAYINTTNSTIVSNSNARTLYINCKSNTTYTISRKAGQRFVALSTEELPANGVIGTNRVYDNTGSQLTITTGEEDKYLAIFYYLSSADTLTEEEIRNSIMIIESTEELPYVPYGTNWVYTKVTGKNLYNSVEFEDKFVNGKIINDNGVEVSDATSKYSKYKMFLKANTTYFLKGAWQRLYFYDKNDNFKSRSAGFTGKNSSYTPTEDEYIRFQVSIDYYNSNKGTEQVELGTVATPYEPYKESIITIPLNGNEIAGIGDYKDELIVDKNGKCWLNKKVGKAIFDGSESGWSKASSTTMVDRYVLNTNLYLNNSNSKCNYFIKGGINQNLYIWFNNNGVQLGFNFASYGTTTLEQWKEWLSTHNLILYQPLATPDPIDLNYDVDIRLFNGVNNISNSDDMDMKIKYVQDINQIINNITNAMLEIGGN